MRDRYSICTFAFDSSSSQEYSFSLYRSYTTTLPFISDGASAHTSILFYFFMTPTIVGSYHEVTYILSWNVALHPDALPVRENGEMDLSRLHRWIEKRREAEKTYKRRRMDR
jgi:hypothetical protein